MIWEWVTNELEKANKNGRDERESILLELIGANSDEYNVWKMGVNRVSPSMADVCVSIRHDYGLLGPIERENLQIDARRWARAFGLEL